MIMKLQARDAGAKEAGGCAERLAQEGSGKVAWAVVSGAEERTGGDGRDLQRGSQGDGHDAVHREVQLGQEREAEEPAHVRGQGLQATCR